MWIATAAECRELDRRATEDFGIPIRVLMERAGMSVYEAIHNLLPSGRVTVFCGKGNNGGDGFVVARLLRENGYEVECLVAAEENELTKDCDEQMRVARAQGVTPIFYSDARWQRKADCLGCRDLVVDALLGTGAEGDVRGPIAEAITFINHSGVPIVSVDIPSGINCDTGEEMGDSVWALRTVTLGLPKPFLFQGVGLEHSGYWSVSDIGFPQVLLNARRDAELFDQDKAADLIPERLRNSHKGQHGSVLVVAGSRRMPGAAVLAAKGALRAGAGLVTVASVPSVCHVVSNAIPEALVLPLDEVGGTIAPSAVEAIQEHAARVHAMAIGPGLTHEQPVLEFLRVLWSSWGKPAVIDADALNALTLGVELPNAPCVLTPHPGELSRMLQMSIAEIQADRFRAVRMAVEKFGKSVLLKGPYSLVGSAGEPVSVNSTGNPGMATGGMGDVLAGMIGTLLAQELQPNHAASVAAMWHGAAGDIAAQEIGPIGYSASEVADRLPRAREILTTPRERP